MVFEQAKDLWRFVGKFKIIEPNGCWEWQGTLRDGYGRFWYKNTNYSAHRLIYKYCIGNIPEKLVIDHLCRNRKCVNPDHLELVSQQENIRRGETGKYNSEKEYCPVGHTYKGDNIIYGKGNRRYCKECGRIRSRNYQRKRRLCAVYDAARTQT